VVVSVLVIGDDWHLDLPWKSRRVMI